MDLSKLPFVPVTNLQTNVSEKQLGKVLADIESKMPVGHQYKNSDKITWGHETTHGINSRVRNFYHTAGNIRNAFYCLDGKALLLSEPKGLFLHDVARKIPKSLRGKIYS